MTPEDCDLYYKRRIELLTRGHEDYELDNSFWTDCIFYNKYLQNETNTL